MEKVKSTTKTLTHRHILSLQINLTKTTSCSNTKKIVANAIKYFISFNGHELTGQCRHMTIILVKNSENSIQFDLTKWIFCLSDVAINYCLQCLK